ncbi:hypothetical protein [Streptomyces sp. NK08204]|nr:hypothetical protein [Streptomyces sp. NK08204]
MVLVGEGCLPLEDTEVRPALSPAYCTGSGSGPAVPDRSATASAYRAA